VVFKRGERPLPTGQAVYLQVVFDNTGGFSGMINFDIKRALHIATTRKEDETRYIDILRTAETGEPILEYINLQENTRYYQNITVKQAIDYMGKWGCSPEDVLGEFGELTEG